jgi:hypothetical protein
LIHHGIEISARDGGGVLKEAGLVGDVGVGVVGGVAHHGLHVVGNRLEDGLQMIGALFEVALNGNADDQAGRAFLAKIVYEIVEVELNAGRRLGGCHTGGDEGGCGEGAAGADGAGG